MNVPGLWISNLATGFEISETRVEELDRARRTPNWACAVYPLLETRVRTLDRARRTPNWACAAYPLLKHNYSNSTTQLEMAGAPT